MEFHGLNRIFDISGADISMLRANIGITNGICNERFCDFTDQKDIESCFPCSDGYYAIENRTFNTLNMSIHNWKNYKYYTQIRIPALYSHLGYYLKDDFKTIPKSSQKYAKMVPSPKMISK